MEEKNIQKHNNEEVIGAETNDVVNETEDNVAEVTTYKSSEALSQEIRKEAVYDYEDKMTSPLMEQDSAVDPYTEPDFKIGGAEYVEPLFLSRGCRKCPESYVPVSQTELSSCAKLHAKNWMKDIRPTTETMFDIVEVRFKNNRKEFYRLPDGLEVTEGDVVAVEGIPGHDVGIVSMTGELCRLQIKKRKIDINSDSIKKLFRRAKKSDIDKWEETMKDETAALLKTRKICEDLGLEMKINDVEFQGDHSKAIFYYTADERVDFRNLIKVLAEEFKVRIEMKQIGIRQEAGKIGGIGTCGRELCCCTWLTNFQSVTTSVAKTQQILPNPQKLAGQCGKLKCCLNFEYEVYADALKNFPSANTNIRTKKGLGMYRKTDVLRGIMWYSYEGENDMYAIPVDSVKAIIEMNNNQQYPDKLEDYQTELMSASGLIDDASGEYEMELMMMEDTPDSVGESSANDKQQRKGDSGNNSKNRNNNRKNNNNNNNNDKQNSSSNKNNNNRNQQGGGNKANNNNANKPQANGGGAAHQTNDNKHSSKKNKNHHPKKGNKQNNNNNNAQDNK